jgi:hypothetical protein
VKRYKQHVSSKRIYEVNIDSHPVVVKPSWTLTHSRDGTPLPHGLADLEVASDGTTARLTTRDWSGLVRITVVFGVHPRTTITESFEVEIEAIPHVSPQLKLGFSQHRDRPI